MTSSMRPMPLLLSSLLSIAALGTLHHSDALSSLSGTLSGTHETTVPSAKPLFQLVQGPNGVSIANSYLSRGEPVCVPVLYFKNSYPGQGSLGEFYKYEI